MGANRQFHALECQDRVDETKIQRLTVPDLGLSYGTSARGQEEVLGLSFEVQYSGPSLSVALL